MYISEESINILLKLLSTMLVKSECRSEVNALYSVLTLSLQKDSQKSVDKELLDYLNYELSNSTRPYCLTKLINKLEERV